MYIIFTYHNLRFPLQKIYLAEIEMKKGKIFWVISILKYEFIANTCAIDKQFANVYQTIWFRTFTPKQVVYSLKRIFISNICCRETKSSYKRERYENKTWEKYMKLTLKVIVAVSFN